MLKSQSMNYNKHRSSSLNTSAPQGYTFLITFYKYTLFMTFYKYTLFMTFYKYTLFYDLLQVYAFYDLLQVPVYALLPAFSVQGCNILLRVNVRACVYILTLQCVCVCYLLRLGLPGLFSQQLWHAVWQCHLTQLQYMLLGRGGAIECVGQTCLYRTLLPWKPLGPDPQQQGHGEVGPRHQGCREHSKQEVCSLQGTMGN